MKWFSLSSFALSLRWAFMLAPRSSTLGMSIGLEGVIG